MTQYFVNGQPLALQQQDFLAHGGQGRIYVKDQTAYKIYQDPAYVIPERKIAELSVLDDSHIVRPRDCILNDRQELIGYTMAHITHTVPLVQCFTSGFRKLHQIDATTTLRLVENMQSVIQSIHDRNILIVDGNEMNYLVEPGDPTQAYFIDVDSYQTPHCPAQVIMLSIRDWHATGFSTATDWFSFAIIACQLFIGIHPYKGTHPGFKRNALKERMLKNVSIFHPRTALPPSVRSFDHIPGAYREWFVKLFEKGERLPPPLIKGFGIMPTQPTIVIDERSLSFDKLYEYPASILDHRASNGTRVVVTQNAIYLDEREVPVHEGSARLVVTGDGRFYAVHIEQQRLCIRDERGLLLHNNLNAESFMLVDSSIYAKYQDKLYEIQIYEVAGRVLCRVSKSWSVMPLAAQLHQGVLVQNILGKAYLTVPYRSGHCASLAIPELDEYRVLEARYEKRVCRVMAFKDQHYDSFIIIFNEAHTGYSISRQHDIDLMPVNFTVLDSGLVVMMSAEGSLKLFSVDQPHKIKEIRDPGIDRDWRLSHEGGQVLAYIENSLFRIRLRNMQDKPL